MRLSHIAVRNIRRHLSRSALLLMVIITTVAVVTSLYLVTRSAERDLTDRVDAYGANIVVAPLTKDLPLTYGGVQLGALTYAVQPLHMADIEKIRSIAERRNVNRVAPKLVEPVDVAGRRVLAVGVQWTEELGLKQWWKLVGRRPEGDHEVILGSRASSVLRLKPGQTLELSGESFVVAAALEPTGTQEDDLLFMDLGVAQRLWRRPGELSLIEVSAFCASCPIETINAQISAALPYARVSAVRTAVESREILLGQFRLFSLVLSALMLVVGCLIVLTATLSAVRDRRGEIGVFRAVGYRGRHILSIILVENVVLALAGGVVGIVVAALVADPLARVVAGVTTVVAPSPLGLLAALAVTVVVVLVAGLYPAWRAAQLSPLLAMREV